MIPVAFAIDSEYSIIVEDNGNSLVIIGFKGSGLVNVPLPRDVEKVKVKGALYSLNNRSIDISIGSNKEAVLLYKTASLTKKGDENWELKLDLIDTNDESVMLILPLDANIIQTEPTATIESNEFLELSWKGDITSIELQYNFPNVDSLDEDEEVPNNHNNYGVMILIFILLFIIIFISVIIFIFRTKKKSNKNNVIKTLSKNEKTVVDIMMEHKGEIKRNKLEKISKLAKSSLANTLNNLEKKNIVEIDKSFTTHYIKFTRWFNEL